MANKRRIWISVLLLLSLAVVSLLLFLLMSGASNVRQQAFAKRTYMQLELLRSATTNYFGIFARWPATMTDLVINSSNIVFVSPGPPWNDGWGRLIVYTPPSATNPTGVFTSFGADGLPGGLDANADIQVKVP